VYYILYTYFWPTLYFSLPHSFNYSSASWANNFKVINLDDTLERNAIFSRILKNYQETLKFSLYLCIELDCHITLGIVGSKNLTFKKI